jgi:hypothetical protein
VEEYEPETTKAATVQFKPTRRNNFIHLKAEMTQSKGTKRILPKWYDNLRVLATKATAALRFLRTN